MIDIRHVDKSFGNKSILQNLSLTFEAGKVYALIGESGSGKTTLLNILAKLEPYDKGSISYRGRDLKQIKAHHYYRHELGYLFQNFGLIDNDSISANLDLGLVGQKLSKQERDSRKKAVLEQVKLGYLDLEQKIFELSGGESQRIALAKLFLKNPPLILADEPTASLDPENADEIMKLLLSLKTEQSCIIIATHNPIIWEQADVIIRMEELQR